LGSALRRPKQQTHQQKASCAPPEGGKGPVSDMTVWMPRTVASTTVARPPNDTSPPDPRPPPPPPTSRRATEQPG